MTETTREEELPRLRAEVERLERRCNDLEIALSTAIEHGDAVQQELEEANQQLHSEVRERITLEKKLRVLVSTITQKSRDLETILHTITEHSDQLDRQWLDRYMESESAANSDPLTGLANRRVLDHSIGREWARARRGGDPIAIIVADIDYFKRFNDTYGHQNGDACLIRVAELFGRAAHRDQDIAARYGGEEFVLLLPYTDLSGAIRVAEALRDELYRLAIPHANSNAADHVTLSMGVYSTIPADEDESTLFAEADRLLYRAKQRGRNRYEAGYGRQPDRHPPHTQETHDG